MTDTDLSPGAPVDQHYRDEGHGEPLLIPKLEQVLGDIKSRGMPVAINTNGLTLTDATAEMFSGANRSNPLSSGFI